MIFANITFFVFFCKKAIATESGPLCISDKNTESLESYATKGTLIMWNRKMRNMIKQNGKRRTEDQYSLDGLHAHNRKMLDQKSVDGIMQIRYS